MLLVRDWMTEHLVTLSPEASVAEALTLCRKRRIRHIPILDKGRLVGIVSDRDLRDASPALGDPERARILQEIRVADVMSQEVITVDPQDSIANAAQQMYELKIESLPVVSEGAVADAGSTVAEEEVLGIVTSSDVMRALVTLAGLPEPVVGSKLACSPIRIEDPASAPWYSSWQPQTLRASCRVLRQPVTRSPGYRREKKVGLLRLRALES